MAELKDIAKKIENILNTNTLGKTFRIFSDSGELAKRNGHENEYRNGLVEIVSSTISNLSGLQFINTSVNLTLYANEEVRGKNSDGDSLEIIELRQILGDFLENYNFKTFAEEFGEATYSTTYVIGATTTLPKGSLGYINDCVPLVTNIGLTLFENGVNSNEWQIFIDGEEVGYTSAVISRTKTAENQPLVESKSTKSVMQTNGFGLDLVVPQISNNLGKAIENEILTGQEYAHMLYIKGKNTEQNYICVFGNLQASLIKNANVGFNLSMVEGVPELLEYSDKWTEYEVESLGNTLCLFRNINEDEVVIFWGDGEFSFSNEENNTHIYEDEGFYTVRVYNKDAIDNEWYEFSIGLYTITYDLDGGEFIGEYPFGYNPLEEEDVVIPNPVKPGYTFTGWTGTDLEEPTIDLVIEAGDFGNKEYTATWEIIDYTISYTLNGGTVSGTNPTTYNTESDEITLINPTKSGYTFTGWSGTGITGTSTSVVIPTGSYGTRTYTANWEVITYTITYVLNGGTDSSSNPSTYTIESSIILLRSPDERTGYTFINWYTTSDFQSGTTIDSIPSGSTGNKTLYAKWQGNQYTMNYDVNGGAQNPYAGPIAWPPSPKTVTFGSSIGTLYRDDYSVKSGYYPDGWYIDGSKISSSTVWNWTSDKTAILNWIQIP